MSERYRGYWVTPSISGWSWRHGTHKTIAEVRAAIDAYLASLSLYRPSDDLEHRRPEPEGKESGR